MADSTLSPNCPRCGAPTPAGASDLCPACLLKQVALGTGADSLPNEPWTAPGIGELAPAFPQLEIIELIGRGGMGAVYKARQKSLGRLVALKILPPQHAANPSFAERFSREAQALAELNHPHIVTVHDFGQAGAFCFLLMEHIDGVNLRQAMGAGRITPEQALAIVPSICAALQYAHEHGIVHRDIKPENLLLDKAGRVKIADFGIARMMGVGLDPASGVAAPDSAGLTQESVLGTPHYMAPEQSAQPAQVDHRADIYALGVVLYELLTGELPVGKFEPPSHKVHIDVRLDAIVLRALEQKPELRYQTIGEMRTQVETVVNESGPAKSGHHAGNAVPRLMNVVTSYVTTPEQLATFECQVFLYRRKSQMLLDDRQLCFTRAGTTTVIPLAAIRDLSIGHYHWVINPAGIDFISVTYDEGGQTKRLFFSPSQGLFGWPRHYNQFVAEWFDAIRAAVAAATGRPPGNTPANQLGTPSSSLEVYAMLLALLPSSFFLCMAVVLPPNFIPVLGAMLTCVGGGQVLSIILMRKRLQNPGRLLLFVALPLLVGSLLLMLLLFPRDVPRVALVPTPPPREPLRAIPPPAPLVPHAPTAVAFGPEINHDITMNDADENGFVFFDFETGTSFKPLIALKLRNQLPELVELTPELKQWIKDSDADILFHLGRNSWAMMTLEMPGNFLGQPAEWKTIQAETAAAVFTKYDAEGMVSGFVPAYSSGRGYRDGFSSVNAFRTRRGSVGVYQTQGYLDTTAAGLRIRYKLVFKLTKSKSLP